MYQFLIVGHPFVVATFLGLKFLSQLETSQQQSKYPNVVAFEDYIIRHLTLSSQDANHIDVYFPTSCAFLTIHKQKLISERLNIHITLRVGSICTLCFKAKLQRPRVRTIEWAGGKESSPSAWNDMPGEIPIASHYASVLTHRRLHLSALVATVENGVSYSRSLMFVLSFAIFDWW
jgi:hypothetical protein